MQFRFESKYRIDGAEGPYYIVGCMPDVQSRFDRSDGDESELMTGSNDPVEITIEVVGGKWKTRIIDALKITTLRSGVLLRKIPQASRKVLTAQLRALERERIVCRAVFGKRSEQVEYSLTPYGRTLVPMLEVMAKWGANHLKQAERNARRSESVRRSQPPLVVDTATYK